MIFRIFLFSLLLLNPKILPQTPPPGSIDVSSAITAHAGQGNSAITCQITSPQTPAVHWECALSMTQAGPVRMLAEDGTPAAGSNTGIAGAFTVAPNHIAWQFTQPSAGHVNWSVDANGTRRSGSF